MPSTRNSHTSYQCSFCNKAQSQVKRLIAGPGKVFICDECVALCQQIITEDGSSRSEPMPTPKTKDITPKFIYKKLDEYVVGQTRAKKALSVAVYNHYKRIWPSSLQKDAVEIEKTNILMLGPTGCGKTLLASTLARILEVPFAIADATSLTEAGYVGEDVENILLRLIQAADYDIPRAQQGIIYIDEIDKIARKGSNASITRDVSGEGVQQALLKIIEGCVAKVPPQGGRKHPHQDFIEISTDNILIICGGTFEGLEQIIERRIYKDKRSIGFKATPETGEDTGSPLRQTSPDDLVEFGFIPEFVGRIPLVVSLESLDMQSLISVLTEPKNALVKQYQSLFDIDNVELVFTDEALEAASKFALTRKTGARGLKTVIEETLLDVMYELPSLKEVTKCILNADAIRGVSHPTLMNSSGRIVEFPSFEARKSA